MNRTLTSLTLVVTTVAAMSLPAFPNVPQMNGLVVSSGDRTQTGLYSLPKEASGSWELKFAVEPNGSTIYTGVFNEDDNIYYSTRCNAQYGTPIIYRCLFYGNRHKAIYRL